MTTPRRAKRAASRGRKRIFVGSSSEGRRGAERIARALRERGFEPVPWWESAALRPGDVTFPRLLALAKTMDGAVFFARGDDLLASRGRRQPAPRDNVILELGAFAMQLGVKRCVLVHEAGAKVPSDLAGVTYLSTKESVDAAARAAAAHFEDSFENDPEQRSPSVVWDPQVVAASTGPLPKNWLLRAFYFGPVGARAWLSITSDPGYELQGNSNPTHEVIVDFVENPRAPRFRAYVSLGPGDARLDQRIAFALRKRDKELDYIPVDLSDGLLLNAVNQLADHGIRVPLGILADFEEHFPYVARQVKGRARSPALYGLFGNTFGNLDGGEASFVGAVRDALAPGEDELLIDVTVRKARRQPFEWTKAPPGAVEFYAHGAATHLGVDAEHLKIHDNGRVRLNPERVTFEESEDDNEVPRTQLFSFYAWRHGGARRLCARIRRYDLKGLIDWLTRRGLEVRDYRRLRLKDDPYDIAILALRVPRKKATKKPS